MADGVTRTIKELRAELRADGTVKTARSKRHGQNGVDGGSPARRHLQKKTLIAAEQTRQDVAKKRTNWRRYQKRWDARKLVSLDETRTKRGRNADETRTKRGRNVGTVFDERGEHDAAAWLVAAWPAIGPSRCPMGTGRRQRSSAGCVMMGRSLHW